MRIALDPDAAPDGTAAGPVRIRRLDDTGAPLGPAETLPGPAELTRLDRELAPRWVIARPRAYRRVLAAGVELGKVHDLELVEGLLVAADGHSGAPHGLTAALARLAGGVPEPDPPPDEDGPPTLFGDAPDRDELPAVVAVHAEQQRRLAGAGARMRLLAVAESAGGLVAEEMRGHGLPWDAGAHDALLTRLLGPRPLPGGRPARLTELAGEIGAALGGQVINPDSPAELVRAFARVGHELTSTRAWELRRVEHPAIAPLLAYKELSRLHVAHGWAWLRAWVRPTGAGTARFHPEYLVGGVVTGRWATRGGGALQIPKAVREAVRADPGWVLVVADAAQLEPRVLAALSGDHALAPGVEDLYAALADREFDGRREDAKLALLSAMYGATGGRAGELVARLRRRYPAAMGFVDDAARAGEDGHLVRSHLGRTSPPAQPGDEVPARARARGRFTRNFVVQATAAEWALVLLAELRLLVRDTPAHLVFFQHDEVLLHVPTELADTVAAAVTAAAATASRRLFGTCPVHFPMQARVVTCYADAKADPRPTGSAASAPR